MTGPTHAIESHTFDTGVDAIAFVTVNLHVEAPDGIEKATKDASRARCQLLATNAGITLFRNGKAWPISVGARAINVEAITPAARARLTKAGCPLSPEDPDMASKATQGLMDGSMVIVGDDTVSVLFDPGWLADEIRCHQLSTASHIAYGLRPAIAGTAS